MTVVFLDDFEIKPVVRPTISLAVRPARISKIPLYKGINIKGIAIFVLHRAGPQHCLQKDVVWYLR